MFRVERRKKTPTKLASPKAKNLFRIFYESLKRRLGQQRILFFRERNERNVRETREMLMWNLIQFIFSSGDTRVMSSIRRG